jgi:prepilin-type N-terminal cleavage/methylation domain-containing protein
MSASARQTMVRRGFTLIELLVVVVIIVILLGIAVPRMRPAMESRNIREAARAITVLTNRTRARAMTSGQPHGVLFERFEQQPEASMVLREVQVPPPYAGDFSDSRIVISLGASGPNVGFTNGEDPVAQGLVQPGDLLRLDYQGHFWRIAFDPTVAPYLWAFASTTTSSPPITPPSGMPFQIFRQPIPTSTDPLRLPRQVVVDLAGSGMDGPPPVSFAAAGRIMVMFSPSGPVSHVYYRDPSSPIIEPHRVTAPLYFLVGKWGRMPLAPGGAPQAEDGLYNYEDANNLWVALNPQTGLATVAELSADQVLPNGASVPTGFDPTVPRPNQAEELYNSRRFAREAQVSKGGR